MALTLVSSFNQQTVASTTITSASLSTAVNDVVIASCVVEDNTFAGTLSISNTGAALTWNSIAVTNTPSNCKVAAWWANVATAGNITATVSMTGAGGKCSLGVDVYTGAHQTTPVPAGNIFSGTDGTDISQAITSTATGSMLRMVAGDWAATNTFAAIANVTLEQTFNQAGSYTSAFLKPTSQPLGTGSFTIGETDTSGTIAWIAFEVVAAPDAPVTTVYLSKSKPPKKRSRLLNNNVTGIDTFNPFSQYSPDMAILGYTAAAGNTGSIASYNQSDSSALTGVQSASGQISARNNSDRSTLTGTQTASGLIQSVNNSDRSQLTGLQTAIGTAQALNNSDRSFLVGQAVMSGNVASRNNSDLSDLSGFQTASGAIASANKADTSLLAGTQTASGSVQSINKSDSATASATQAVIGTIQSFAKNDASNLTALSSAIGSILSVNRPDRSALTAVQTATGSISSRNKNDLTATVSGVNFYVRQGATGSGTGADWTNAYTDLPTSLDRGATYYIADGSYASHTFNDANSGTTLITIKKATDSDHGTNTGWLSSYGDGQAIFVSFDIYTDYYLFDGQVRNTNWRNGGVNQYGISSGNIRLDDTIGGGGDNLTFKYIDFHGGGRDTGAGDDVVYSLVGNTNITFQYCALRDSDRTIILTRGTPTNWLIEYCYIARNASTPAIHGEMWSFTDGLNVTYRYNIVVDIEGTAVLAGINDGTMTNLHVYGNVFWWTDDYINDVGRVPGHNVGITGVVNIVNDASNNNFGVGTRFYNNTIVRTPGTASGVRVDAGSDTEVRNNYWYDTVRTTHNFSGVSSNNHYFNVATSIDDATGTICSSSCNKFVSYFTTIPESAADFSLAVAFPSGFSLLSPFNTDPNGITRGADGVWDIGAFEFVSSGSTGSITSFNKNDSSVLTGSTVSAVTGAIASTNNNDRSALLGATAASGSIQSRNKSDTSLLQGTQSAQGTISSLNKSDLSALSGFSGAGVTGSVSSVNNNDYTSVIEAIASGTYGSYYRDYYYKKRYQPARKAKQVAEQASDTETAPDNSAINPNTALKKTKRQVVKPNQSNNLFLAKNSLKNAENELLEAENRMLDYLAGIEAELLEEEQIIMRIIAELL